jgi:hypothetical protein
LDSTALESIDGNSFKDNSLAISPIWSIQFKQVVGSLTAGEIALMAISTNLRTPKFMSCV